VGEKKWAAILSNAKDLATVWRRSEGVVEERRFSAA
jgi:hypothetical protein